MSLHFCCHKESYAFYFYFFSVEDAFKSVIDSIKSSENSQWLYSKDPNRELPPKVNDTTTSVPVIKFEINSTNKISLDSLKEVLNKEVNLFFGKIVKNHICLEKNLVPNCCESS